MNPKRGSKTQDIALSGLLFALAMALSFVEGTLVIPGLMPGMKLGLANIVLLVMWVLYYHFPVQPTWFILSVCGALAHNVGQLLGASVILSSAMSLYYAPVMLVFGLIMGSLTSITLRALLPALGRLGYNTREKRG